MKTLLLLALVAVAALFACQRRTTGGTAQSDGARRSKESKQQQKQRAAREAQETLRALERFKKGDREPEVLTRLLRRASHWQKDEPTADELRRSIRNAYFDRLSVEALTAKEPYNLLKWEYKDVRLNVTDVLLANREILDKGFAQHWKSKRRSERFDTEKFVVHALRDTYDKSIKDSDRALFDLAESVRKRMDPTYDDPWMAHSRTLFHLKAKNARAAADAALHYFAIDKNWRYGTRSTPGFLTQSARAVLETRSEPEALVEAARWARRATEKSETPPVLGLYRTLLIKTGETEQADRVGARLARLRALLNEMVGRYPAKFDERAMKNGNATHREYKAIESLDKKFKPLSRFISRESSLFKKGEKIEPIAVLDQTDDTVVLLSRVHLATGSLLPVTHIRSYYMKTEFKRDGTAVSNAVYASSSREQPK